MALTLKVVHLSLILRTLPLLIKLGLALQVALQGLLNLSAQNSWLRLQFARHLLPELIDMDLVLLDCKVGFGHM